MKKIALVLSLSALVVAIALALSAAPAQAQATRTWVSGVGDDVNPCSRTAPCKTFAGAISKTAINGEINCLDPGGFGAVTITKSISIDCHEIYASILASGTTGVIVNIAVSGSDPLRTVRLRNININGSGSGTRTGINGINVLAATIVYLDDMLVTDFTQNGLIDQRSAAGRLHIRNSTFRNNAGTGVLINPSVGVARIDADMEGVAAVGNSTGITAVDTARVQIKRSTISNNTNNGLDVEGAGTEVNVDGSMITNNANNALLTASSGVLRVSNSDISHNGTIASGAWVTYGNNRGLGNGAGGTGPTPAGGISNELGQF